MVGKQPFRCKSGTNDKAGSMLNLLRWVSPRLIKETFVTPTDYRYPFLDKEKKTMINRLKIFNLYIHINMWNFVISEKKQSQH